MWVLMWVECGRSLHRVFADRADADRHRQSVDHLDAQVLSGDEFHKQRQDQVC